MSNDLLKMLFEEEQRVNTNVTYSMLSLLYSIVMVGLGLYFGNAYVIVSSVVLVCGAIMSYAVWMSRAKRVREVITGYFEGSDEVHD